MRTRFKPEAECQRRLERLRWPQGLKCPRCRSRRVTKFTGWGKTGKKRWLYNCLNCRYQYTVTAGTFLHDSRLPLGKWFAAIFSVTAKPPGPGSAARRKAFAPRRPRRGRGAAPYRRGRGPGQKLLNALRLQRELKLGSYETAWRLVQRLRHAQRQGNYLLRKIVDSARRVRRPRRRVRPRRRR